MSQRASSMSVPLLTGMTVVALLSPACGYPNFQAEIPNGDAVPDPVLDALWAGVGHNNAKGGGSRNVFGKAFAHNGYKWDAFFCGTDTDGDGKTNGEELGDPECVWKKGDTPATSEGLSHPGICEPVESEYCKEKNEDVMLESASPFECDAISEEGVKSSILRFAPTQVPAKETSYYCQYFPLDFVADGGEHVIAYEPVIDNVQVMHHTIAYGCRGNNTAEMAGSMEQPQECSEGMSSCQEMMILWTVGLDGMCFPDAFGALIGEGGYTGIWMEHHWNNPSEESGMTDSSGLKLYHTPNKRDENGAYLTWGAFRLTLPPNEQYILQSGECHPDCTSKFNQEVTYLAQIIPHMHYLGEALSVSINDKLVLEETDYSYDDPKVYNFDPPLEFRRGDRLTVNCTFTTFSRDEMTHFGLATSDEMCFAVMLSYPVDQSLPPFCQMTKEGLGLCGEDMIGDFGDCDIDSFWFDIGSVWMEFSQNLTQGCDPNGVECLQGCPAVLERLGNRFPCLRGTVGDFVRSYFVYVDEEDKSLVNALYSCHPVIYDPRYVDGTGDTSSGSVPQALLSLSLFLMALFMHI